MTSQLGDLDSKPFDTLIVFLKEIFEKVRVLKKGNRHPEKKSMEKNYPACKELNVISMQTVGPRSGPTECRS